jgi:hypothetical protein
MTRSVRPRTSRVAKVWRRTWAVISSSSRPAVVAIVVMMSCVPLTESRPPRWLGSRHHPREIQRLVFVAIRPRNQGSKPPVPTEAYSPALRDHGNACERSPDGRCDRGSVIGTLPLRVRAAARCLPLSGPAGRPLRAPGALQGLDNPGINGYYGEDVPLPS